MSSRKRKGVPVSLVRDSIKQGLERSSSSDFNRAWLIWITLTVADRFVEIFHLRNNVVVTDIRDCINVPVWSLGDAGVSRGSRLGDVRRFRMGQRAPREVVWVNIIDACVHVKLSIRYIVLSRRANNYAVNNLRLKVRSDIPKLSVITVCSLHVRSACRIRVTKTKTTSKIIPIFASCPERRGSRSFSVDIRLLFNFRKAAHTEVAIIILSNEKIIMNSIT